MKIKFNRLKLHNFLSFEQAEYYFNNKGYTYVMGKNYFKPDNSLSNGSGKSSLWEAVCWCLCGETIRGLKDVQRLDSSGKCEVEIEFESNNDNFILVRSDSPSKLQIIKNGKDISGKGIKDTKKILADELPELTSNLISSVIILGQGLPQRFSSNSPSGRKEVLEQLSNSGFMIEDVKRRVTDRQQELTSLIRTKEDEALKLETMISSAKANLTKFGSQLESLPNKDELCEQIDSIESELAELEKTLVDFDAIITDLKAKKVDAAVHHSSIESITASKIKEITDEYLPELQGLDIDIHTLKGLKISLEKEINSLKAIKDVCPVCGQKLPNVFKPDTTEKENELVNLSNSLKELEIKLHDKTLEKLQKIESVKLSSNVDIEQSNKLIADINSNLEDTSKKYNDTNSIKKSTEASLNSLKMSLAKLESNKTLLETNIEDCNKLISESTDKVLYIYTVLEDLNNHLSIINKILTLLKRDFRGYILNNIIEYIQSRAKIYCQDIFGNENIKFYLNGNNIQIEFNSKKYECLSGGERQKIDIIIQFSLRDMLCQYLNFSCNILVLDEITDNLDMVGCQSVYNLISTRLHDVENIYIISHHSDLQFPVDYELLINKGEDGISRIV